ncbi:MAG TPA: hypothetical protein VF471_15085 [Pseudoxanthomonas sp.]
MTINRHETVETTVEIAHIAVDIQKSAIRNQESSFAMPHTSINGKENSASDGAINPVTDEMNAILGTIPFLFLLTTSAVRLIDIDRIKMTSGHIRLPIDMPKYPAQ